MLPKKLHRIIELDAAITNMQHHLENLHSERNTILARHNITPPPALSTAALYEQLTTAWLPHKITLPTYKSFLPKLKKTQQAIDKLQHDNPLYVGKLAVVAVPPFNQLRGFLGNHLEATDTRFIFADNIHSSYIKKSARWSIIVLIDPAFNFKVAGLASFLASNNFSYSGYDCRQLGAQELIASELQGVTAVTDEGWTLLFKDDLEQGQVLCATRRNDTVIFEIDDSDCLLGNNYARPAIKAA